MKFQTLNFARMLVLVFALSLVTGCSGGRQDTSESRDSKAISLVRDAEKLQEGVKLGQRLNTVAKRDRDTLSTLLLDIKLALVKLSENSSDVEALRLLKRALVEWDKSAVQIQRTDQAVFGQFISDVHELLEVRSRAVGFKVDDLTWVLYANDFASGVEPFTAVSNGVQWEADRALDEPLVHVSGYDLKAWLISPTFDLRDVRDPGFRVNHMIMINRNTGKYATDAFDRQKIVAQTFKILVSTNYLGGDPTAATWTPVDASPLPSSYNFHAVLSPIVSLAAFRGEHVSVAFLFDMSAAQLGHHYVTWQLNRFELTGAGAAPDMKARPRELWAQSFTTRSLSPFQSVTYGPPEAGIWAPWGPGPQIRFAKIGTSGVSAESWLLSPRLTLTGEQLQMSLRETVRNPDFAQMRILISPTYQDGDPRLADWQELKRPNPPSVGVGEWKDLPASAFDLKAFAGQSVVIGFQFRDSGAVTDEMDWEIEKLQITGLNPDDLKVESRDYHLKVGSPPPPSGGELKTYDFTKGDLAPFHVESVAESSVKWIPYAVKGAFKYAKAGSADANADTWLISPPLQVQGQVKMNVHHTVKNPDWTKWEMLISTDYQSGSPTSATWTSVPLTPATAVPADKWTDLVTADVDLSPYSGHAVVVGFHYRDASGAGTRVWEVESLHFQGEGSVHE